MTGLEPDSGLDHSVSATTTSRSGDCVFSLDLDWRYTSANEPAARLAGCTPSDLVGRTIWEVFPQAVGSELDRRFRWALEHQQPVEFEGSLEPAETRLAVRALPGPDGLAVYVQEVSERRRGERETPAAEPTFELSERRRRLAFDATAVGMMLVTPDRRIVEANAALGRMLGYEPDELVGRPIPELTHPDDVEGTEGTFDEIAKPGVESLVFEQRYVRRDGSPLWARVGVSPARHADGSVEFLVAQVEDITPLKQAEEELARSRRLYEVVMEHAPDLIAVADLDGTMRLVSRSVERVLGYTPEELAGRNFATLLAPDALEEGAHWVGQVRSGEVNVPGLRVRHRNGDTRLLQGRVSFVEDALGEPAFLIATGRDVTDERELEEDLRHRQKLEAVGGLAAGVAHDFNNLLTAVFGYSELALAHVEIDPAVCREEIGQITQAAMRARELTHKLLAFGRKQTLTPQLVSLNDIIAETEPLLRRLITEAIEIDVRLAPGLGRCLIDPGSIQQVLINLCVNARDAMPAGGRLRVETRNEAAPAQLGITAGDCVALAVADEGRGMDEPTLERIFEPFFTTKEAGVGTGLGLATSYGIVAQSGGAIDVESEPDRGSTFTVYLPREAPQESGTEPVLAHTPRAAAQAPGGTVLVVEDEEPVRRLMSVQLTAAGYEVLVAANGAEALELADKHAFDILVTDLVMPGMNGLELAARLAETRPRLKTVYTSGYSADVLEGRQLPDNSLSTYLQKPYSSFELLEKIGGLGVGGH